MSEVACKRCQEMMNREMGKEAEIDSTITSTHPTIKIIKQDFVLLPAWFLTLRDGQQSNTIMVNGQTGKVIGMLLFTVWKAVLIFLFLWALLTYPLIRVCYRIFDFFHFMENVWIPELVWVLVMLILVGVIGYSMSIIQEHRKYTADWKLKNYATDRQGEE